MGAFFSTISALFWAIAVIFYKKAGETYTPTELNLYKNLISMLIFVLLCSIFGYHLIPNDSSLIDVVLLGMSGIMGIAISDTLFFMSINRLGAS